jgi:acetolactate synthase-1/2/3 large subunit
MKVAELIVKCLENEGVEYIFGLPGEENIDITDALLSSKIRFILVRHEQGASFMADFYGRLTGKAGVCLATLGPGAINLTLGTADAQLDSAPLVALVAQGSLDRLFKESHQYVDLLHLFRPITKWGDMLVLPDTTPEMVRKAFKQAQSERPGATVIVVPLDVARAESQASPLPLAQPQPQNPAPAQVARTVKLFNEALNPIVLAGYGVCRSRASEALVRFADRLQVPVATTFMAKGVIPDNHPMALGTIGFMQHDYLNFGFDQADVVVTVGYDLVEYPPESWNPHGDKKIVHIHRGVAEVDKAYILAVGIQGNIAETLDAIAAAATPRRGQQPLSTLIRNLLKEELETAAEDQSFPLKPQKIVADLRRALKETDIVLCDTGALKMWMARLFPCYQPDTCLISNGLATMGFSLPGALAAKLVYPDRQVVAVMGDGSFLMNSQELETAVREGIPFVVLIWRDDHYGLIKWKQEIELGRPSFVKFTNPDLVKYAETFGIRGYRIEAAGDLLPTLQEALAANRLAVIECPVDYSENKKLTDKLGHLTRPL